MAQGELSGSGEFKKGPGQAPGAFPVSKAVSPSGKAGQPQPAHVVEATASLRRMLDIIEQDGRYAPEAFRFLQEGLEFTVKRMHGPDAFDVVIQPEGGPETDTRHVTGTDLCLGLRDLAAERWGRLARVVLNSWGIRTTHDFGEMVFLLVRHDFLQKTEGDSIEHFHDVFDFSHLEGAYRVDCGRLSEIDAAVFHAGKCA